MKFRTIGLAQQIYEGMGATVVCLQNGSGADPLGALRTYGERVIPALGGARV